jgi:hypothetical protein
LSFAPLEDPIQGLAAGICENEHHPTVATGDLHGPGGPCGIKVSGERAFVLELPEALGRRVFCGGCDDQDGGVFAGVVTAVKCQLPVVSQRLQPVTNILWHGVPRSTVSARTI